MKIATGPLKVSKNNQRYFEDISKGKIVYLTGTHTWNNFQDIGSPVSNFDYNSYLKFLLNNGMNFIRFWVLENPRWVPWSSNNNFKVTPMPYRRIGNEVARDGLPKFNLDIWNQEYFDRLKYRVEQAGRNGIYVGIMLFSGCSIGNRDWPEKDPATSLMVKNPWDSHPYNKQNNINGVDGDLDNDGQGWELRNITKSGIIERQKAYVKKVIDETNNYDNVLYEIANEDPFDTWEWQYEIINFIKEYEITLSKKHPVGMTASWKQANDLMFKSPADWISPYYNEGEAIDPLTAYGEKVWIADTDHVFPNMGVTMDFAWKAFLRGANIISMDNKKTGEAWSYFRKKAAGNVEKFETERLESISQGSFEATLGDLSQKYIKSYADRMKLDKVNVCSNLSSTGYCLADAGREYLVFQPVSGEFTMDLSGAEVELSIEWFNPVTGETFKNCAIKGGNINQHFTAEFAPVVLYLKEI